MGVERIAGEGYEIIKEVGSAKNSPAHPPLKFILFQAAGNGYLWIDMGPRHDFTEKGFLRYLQTNKEDTKPYVPLCEGDVQVIQNGDGRALLKFSDNRVGLLKCELLKQTLDEVLDKEKFDYTIG